MIQVESVLIMSCVRLFNRVLQLDRKFTERWELRQNQINQVYKFVAGSSRRRIRRGKVIHIAR